MPVFPSKTLINLTVLILNTYVKNVKMLPKIFTLKTQKTKGFRVNLTHLELS